MTQYKCAICKDSGYVSKEGELSMCACKMKGWIRKQLAPFLGIGKPIPEVTQFVENMLWKHEVNQTKQGADYPIHWYMIDPLFVDRTTINRNKNAIINKTFTPSQWLRCNSIMDTPWYWYKHFFAQYVISTRYASYEFLTISRIAEIYRMTEWEDSTDATETHFYGFQAKTFFIACNVDSLARDSMSILTKFLEQYYDRNIIIYGDNRWNNVIELTRVTDGAGRQFYPMDGVSLKELLDTKFGESFKDALSYTNNKRIKADMDLWKRKKQVKDGNHYKFGDLDKWI